DSEYLLPIYLPLTEGAGHYWEEVAPLLPTVDIFVRLLLQLLPPPPFPLPLRSIFFLTFSVFFFFVFFLKRPNPTTTATRAIRRRITPPVTRRMVVMVLGHQLPALPTLLYSLR